MATYNGNEAANTINGSESNDTITAKGGNDKVYAKGGADYIDAGIGNDWIEGGAGNDRVLGGDGADTVIGGTGDDTLSGGNHNDTLLGGDGNDRLFGDMGEDTLFGGNGNDSLEGNGIDRDFMHGDAGNDTLKVGQNDELWGDADNDTFNFSTTIIPNPTYYTNYGNIIHGGTGTDTVVVTNNVAGSMSWGHSSGVGTLHATNNMDWNSGQIASTDGIERIVFAGTQGGRYWGLNNDTPSSDVTGSNNGDLLYGSRGNDTYRGGAGNDQLWGGKGGTNTLTGGTGRDKFALLNDSDGIVTVTDFKRGEDTLFLDNGLKSIQVSNGSTIITMDDPTIAGSATMKLVGVTGLQPSDYQITNDHSSFFGSDYQWLF